MNKDDIRQFEKKTTKIAYYDPFNVYKSLKDDLHKHLPLVNLHWHPVNRPLRSIPQLDVDLVEETASNENVVKHQMLGLSNAPYLKILFVQCEDGDTYRSVVRNMIREWLAKHVLSLRDPTEWLIVHYVPAGSRAINTKRFRSSVFDKIRNDFGMGSKRDRCLQIKSEFKNEMEEMEIWSETVTKLKEGVLEAFSRRVELYQQEIIKLEEKKDVMGWNFGIYFVMKEGLALSFDAISLHEDALIVYDELEEVFGNLTDHSFFSGVGFDGNEVVNQSILRSKDASNYRLKIMSNEISLFDFHCYLFAQQAHLLLYVSRASSSASISALKLGELYLRLRTFLSEMTSMLKYNKKSSIKIAEWVYCVVKEFYEATASSDESLAREVSEGKGEMSLLRRLSLEEGAAKKGWLISGVLADVSLEEETKNTEDYEVCSTELKDLLKNETSFHNEYRRLTAQAIRDFEVAGRTRTVSRLNSQLALLEFQLENYEEAAEILDSIPMEYKEQGWNAISTSLSLIYIECLEKLGRNADIFTFSLDLLRHSNHLTPKNVKTLIDNVQRLSMKCSANVPCDDLFEIMVEPFITGNEPGIFTIPIKIKTKLSEDFEIDQAILHLQADDQEEEYTLELEKTVFKGDSTMNCQLSTNNFIEGTFSLISLELRKNKLILFKTWEDIFIQCYPTINQIWTELERPRFIELAEKAFSLKIHFPFDSDECQVSVRSLNEAKLVMEDAQIEDRQQENGSAPQAETTVKSPGLTSLNLGSISAGTKIVRIPLASGTEQRDIIIDATISYVLSESSHSSRFRNRINLSLLIDATEHDYFKMTKLFARFCIGSRDELDPVTVTKVHLVPPDGLTVSSPMGNDSSAIAFTGAPLNYVFAIERQKLSPVNEPLLLEIWHTTARAEYNWHISQFLEKKLRNFHLERYILLIWRILDVFKIDMTDFCMTGEVVFDRDEFLETVKRSGELTYLPSNDIQKLTETLKNLEIPTQWPTVDVTALTSKLTIPIAISHIDVIHSVELTLPEKSHFVISEAISAKLSIISTRHWAAEKENANSPAEFYYEIQIVQDTWALSGKRIARFKLDKEKMTTKQDLTDVILIPLREGKLVYPKITVYPVSEKNGPRSETVVDYKSASDSILVASERDSVTITVP